jgi:hypothetical protein
MWRALPIIGLVLAAAGLGGAFAMQGEHHHAVLVRYLVAWYGFLAIGLGGLFFVILQHLVRAGWSIAVRRLAENAMITLPMLCLVGLPIVFVRHARPLPLDSTRAVEPTSCCRPRPATSTRASSRSASASYFAIWTDPGADLLPAGRPAATTTPRSPRATPTDARLRGPGAVPVRPVADLRGVRLPDVARPALVLDHVRRLLLRRLVPVDPRVPDAVSIFLRKSGYLKGVVTDEHYHDLGKYLFGFTVFYTYIAFSQYFLIWYANIPEETIWFGYRIADDFLPLTYLLCLGRFPIPFFFLLPRGVKRNAGPCSIAATWILFMEFVDMYWLIQPVLAHHHAIEPPATTT